jgi:hypothetical protein
MRQILNIHQTDTVENYTEKFNHLCHQILLHDPNTSEVFFVERYIAGLSDEIRSVVLLRMPEDVDTASMLALLQETEQENIRQHHHSFKSSSKYNYKAGGAAEKAKFPVRADDTKRPDKPRWDDKLESLCAYRKSKGECFTCGEKWSRTHKCPDKIPLHILEELLDVLPPGGEASTESPGDMSSEDELMCVDLATTEEAVPTRCRTIRLHGRVGQQEVLILVDSGSGASFVDAALVEKLQMTKEQCAPSRFVVANGETMTSDRMVRQLSWQCQGNSFQQDMKILPLSCYDIILGGDWLEEFSPLWVHWRQRRMRFRHKGKKITLLGIQDKGGVGQPINAQQLQGLPRRGAVAQCIHVQPVHQDGIHRMEVLQGSDSPTELSEVLAEFQDLFTPTDTLPPRRKHDHKIPLVPGAQPVNARPYRYAPHQKDEIERQIHQILRQGIIRHSSSPFASPVLLVRKKDGT